MIFFLNPSFFSLPLTGQSMDHTLRSKVLRCEKYHILDLWFSLLAIGSIFQNSETVSAQLHFSKAIIFPMCASAFLRWLGWGIIGMWKVLQCREKSLAVVSTIKKCYLLEKENPRSLLAMCFPTTDPGEGNAMDFF